MYLRCGVRLFEGWTQGFLARLPTHMSITRNYRETRIEKCLCPHPHFRTVQYRNYNGNHLLWNIFYFNPFGMLHKTAKSRYHQMIKLLLPSRLQHQRAGRSFEISSLTVGIWIRWYLWPRYVQWTWLKLYYQVNSELGPECRFPGHWTSCLYLLRKQNWCLAY